MALKTRPSRPRRSGGYRPRRRPAARESRFPSFSFDLPQRLIPWAIGGTAVGIALVILFFAPIINGLEAILGALGLGVIIVLGALAWDYRVMRNEPDFTREFLRLFGGWHMLGAFVFGLLSLASPGWSVGDVDFADQTLGGDVGNFFTSSFPGVVAWVALGGTGFSLVWPYRARQIADGLIAIGGWLISLEIPQRAARGIGAFIGVLLPRAEEEYEDDEDLALPEPNIAEFDEEWEESDEDEEEEEDDEEYDEDEEYEEEEEEEVNQSGVRTLYLEDS